MSSLYRIATALDTTPQALFGGADSAAAPTLARAVDTIGARDRDRRRVAASSAAARRRAVPRVELVGLSTEFLEPWQHDGFEALYVLAGPIDVEVDGVCTHAGHGRLPVVPGRPAPPLSLALGRRARVLLIEYSPRHGKLGATHVP